MTGRVVLKVEGKLMGRWVDELRRSAAVVLDGDEAALAVDLSGLDFADRDGTALLGALHACGARLTNCSAYAEAQLRDMDVACGEA